MTTINIAVLSGYRTPPLGDQLYTQAARDFATIGEGLLLIHNAPLLAVPSPGNGGQKPYPVVLWNAALSPCRKRTRAACENDRNGPALSALCLAAAMLYARLAACQLADTSPQGLCAITDGTGVVFAQTSHFAQGLPMTAARSLSVLAMAADGPWPLLIAGPANARIH